MTKQDNDRYIVKLKDLYAVEICGTIELWDHWRTTYSWDEAKPIADKIDGKIHRVSIDPSPMEEF